MKHFNILLLLFLTPIVIVAQQIKVISSTNNVPISGVAIYNTDQSKNAITNASGEASLNAFSNAETIYFKHLSYALKTITKAQLGKSNIIYLDLDAQGIDEVVVSASRFEQSKKDVPQKIVSLTTGDIQFSNPQTSADLLENTGNVYVQKSQYGGGSPMIRGFATNRVLITVDGVRMNNAIFRGGNLQNVISIDPFSVEKTEVTLGSGSVVYGSDAIGGVMGFYTQKPQVSTTNNIQFNANAIARYATASEEKTGHVDFNFGLKKWAFLTNVSYNYFDDLRMGSHGPTDYLRPEYVVTTSQGDEVVQNSNPKKQVPTGYDQINLMQKVRFERDKTLNFDLGVFYTATSNYSRYDRLIRYRRGTLRSAEWNYGPQKWFMSNLQITKISSNSNIYDKIKFIAAYQNFQESRMDRDFQSVARNVTEEAVNAYSANLDFEKAITPKTDLFYGAEYLFNKVKSTGSEENISTGTSLSTVSRYPDGASWQSAAAYASIKYKPNTNFVFQSGLRYNYIDSKANFKANNVYLNLPFETANNTYSALTGTAGISWAPNPVLQWKFNLSTAFRAPNIDDVGKVFDSEPGSVVVPNNNLKSEYAYGGDLGLVLNFNNKLLLDFNTYYTYLDNALVRRDYSLNGETEIMYNGELSNVQAIQNAAKANVYGFEVGIKLPLTKTVQFTSQYNVIGGTENENGEALPVRHAAPNFGNSHLVWIGKNIKLDLFANYNNELSNYQLAPSEVEKDYMYALDKNGEPYSPSWYTLNLRSQYKFNNALTLTASLENITDQRYKTYSSGIAAAGRNVILALKYSI